MTKKMMLINETDDETRVAIVEDSILQEMLIEHRTKEQTKNNIYRGTVVQTQSSLQAAFVDFGHKKHGFLPSSEINPAFYQKKSLNNNSPIQQKLKKGQPVLVQVTREAVDQKGAALTTNVSLPGRFMVLMANSNKGGISKRIDDPEERDRLKSFISAIEVEKHSAIIRTAGVGRDLVELKKDYTTLKKTWEDIHRSFKEMKKSGLILEESDVVTRTLRDYYTEDIEEIWVDNPETFQKVLEFLKKVVPRRQKDLKLFVGDRSLFSSYKIERQVEQLTSRDVKLPSGGSIVIDQTEALVAIDVNSGKSNQEGDIDATALRTNLEAAKEIARQLRLRNLGGLIVTDFIDMEHENSRRKVEEELQNAMSRDKAQRKFNPISQFGLLEMSRQRLSVGISSTVESVCPICNGKGRIPSLLASTNLILRSIRETAAKGNLLQIEGVLPLELANHLLNERRQSITDLELEFGIDIILRGNPDVTVFGEAQLKPTFESKSDGAPEEPDSRKEEQRSDSDKKRSRHREKDAGRKSEKVDKKRDSVDRKPDSQDISPEPVEPQSEEPETISLDQQPVSEPPAVEAEVGKATPAVPEIADKPKTDPPKAQQPKTELRKTEKKPVQTGGTSIHPSCLFSDIQEINPEELAEITTAFENRLKGKPSNQPPLMIDQKYLWKNRQNQVEKVVPPAGANDLTDPKEIVGPSPEALPQEKPVSAAEKPAETKQDAGEVPADQSRRRSSRSKRRSSRKPTSSQAKTTGQEKPDSEQQKNAVEKEDGAAGKESEKEKPVQPHKKRQNRSRTNKNTSKSTQGAEKSVTDQKSISEVAKATPETAEKETPEKKKKPRSSSHRSRKSPAKQESLKTVQEDKAKPEKKVGRPAKAKKTAAAAKKEADPQGK